MNSHMLPQLGQRAVTILCVLQEHVGRLDPTGSDSGSPLQIPLFRRALNAGS